MEHFQILPWNKFSPENRPSAAFKRPKEIAYFSYDDEHHFHLDERSLRYYYPPRLGSNLSEGFETFQQLDDTQDDHLDSLLRTIIDLEAKTGSRCTADIITWRGMMTKIMAAPYEMMNGFEMNATKFQDTIFIEESHEKKLESRKAQHMQPTRPGAPSQDLMSFWGYKFETISLLPDQWDPTSRDFIESREDLIVNNYAQYCSIVKTGIGRTRLVIGGEVDALWDCRPANKDLPINWVELKTAAEVKSPKDQTKFQRKLLKFWIQSFLLGVPKVIVGFRSANGILQQLQEFETKDIPGMVKGSSKAWDGFVCINFTAAFLEWLKDIISGHGVWRIRRREKSPVMEVFKLEDSGTGNILSREFVDWRTKSEEERAREVESAKQTLLASI